MSIEFVTKVNKDGTIFLPEEYLHLQSHLVRVQLTELEEEEIQFKEDGNESVEDDNPLSIARFEEAMQEVRQGFDELGYTEADALQLIAKVRREKERERATQKT